MLKARFSTSALVVITLAMILCVHCGDSEETTQPVVDPLDGAVLCLSENTCDFVAECDTSASISVTNCGNSTVLAWTAVADSAWLSLSAA